MSKFKSGTSKFKAPSPSNTMVRKNTMDDGDSAGVASGLSALSGFDAEDQGPMIDYEEDSLTGNATERVEPYTEESVSKKGISFKIC